MAGLGPWSLLPAEGYWYVVREYSGHAAKNSLLKELSRGFVYKQEALNWLDYCQSCEPKIDKAYFFIYFRECEWTENVREAITGLKGESHEV